MFVFACLWVRVLCLISSCICSLSGSVFVGVSRDACVCLAYVLSGDECVYVCLWMFAHVVCGLDWFVCPKLPGCMSRLGILFIPACVCVRIPALGGPEHM